MFPISLLNHICWCGWKIHLLSCKIQIDTWSLVQHTGARTWGDWDHQSSQRERVSARLDIVVYNCIYNNIFGKIYTHTGQNQNLNLFHLHAIFQVCVYLNFECTLFSGNQIIMIHLCRVQNQFQFHHHKKFLKNNNHKIFHWHFQITRLLNSVRIAWCLNFLSCINFSIIFPPIAKDSIVHYSLLQLK